MNEHIARQPPSNDRVPSLVPAEETVNTTELSTLVFQDLLSIVGRQGSLPSALRDLAVLAAKIVPGADEVSVSLVRDGHAWTMAFSGDLAPALDERQYAAGAGPCLHAAASGHTVSIDDTADDTAYPEFSRQARRHGVKHVLAVGIPARLATSGAINLYGHGTAGPFDARTRRLATDFADFAGIAMINAAVSQGAMAEVLQMREAMTSRAGIEQAKGILMLQHHCDQVVAFDMLRRRSMEANQKLRAVAQDVIDEAVGSAR